MPHIFIRDIIDILLVALLIYEVYKLVKGTNAMKIFWSILVIVILWRIVDAFSMRLSGAILSAVVNVGLIALVVVFQPEIRRFLLMMGTHTSISGENVLQRFKFWKRHIKRNNTGSGTNFEPYIQACMHMSASKTGALIIFKRQNEVDDIISTGERIDALTSSALLEQLFYKNTPLHDGAVIVSSNRILAARCILPVTSRIDIDPNLGLRHRSAIGVTEQLDVVSVIVSEETGAISYAVEGEIHHNVTPVELRQSLEKLIG